MLKTSINGCRPRTPHQPNTAGEEKSACLSGFGYISAFTQNMLNISCSGKKPKFLRDYISGTWLLGMRLRTRIQMCNCILTWHRGDNLLRRRTFIQHK